MGVGLWFMFQHFQEGKVVENMTKFYRIDKNSKIIVDENFKLETEKNPIKIAEIKKKIEEAQSKVDKAKIALEKSKPYIHQFESKNAEWVANEIANNVDYKTTEISRIGDN